MRYIREDLAGDLGGQVQFDIICGTSVGAIHACFFAATADIADKQGRMLVDRWESFVLEEMVSFGVKEFMRAPGHAARQRAHRGGRRATPAGRHRADAAARTRRAAPHPVAPHRAQHPRRHSWSRCRSPPPTSARARRSCSCRAPERPAPDVEQGPVRARPVGHDGRRARAGVGGAADPLPARSASASASSATAACARTRRCRRRCAWAPTRCWSSACATSRPLTDDVPEESMPFPGAAFLVGKILDAFLLDHIDYDLDRLRRFNARHRGGARGRQPRASRRASTRSSPTMRGAPYRIVGEYMIRPVGRPRRDRRPRRALRALQGVAAAAPGSSFCGGWRPRAAPTRPTCCRTSCSTASTPPRSRAWATRTRARTTTSWPSSWATRSSETSARRGLAVSSQRRTMPHACAEAGAGGYFTRRSCGRRRRRAASGCPPARLPDARGWSAGGGCWPRDAVATALATPRPPMVATSAGMAAALRRLRRLRSRDDDRDVTRHVLGVQNAATVVAGNDVNSRPGDHRQCAARARTTASRAPRARRPPDPGSRSAGRSPYCSTRCASCRKASGTDHARAAGVEMQRGPPLLQERQKSLLLRGAFGIHPRS